MLAMRILEIVDVRWWNACAYYGVELARGLMSAGEDVVVAGSPGSPPVERARSLGLPVWTGVRFAAANPIFSAIDFPALLAGLRRFDLVDAHRAEGHLLGALASALGGGPPVVRTRGDIRPPRAHPLNRWLHHRLTSAVVVPGEFMRERLMGEFGLSPELVEVIPAGIDVDHFRRSNGAGGNRGVEGAALCQRLEIGDGEPVIGMVARLSEIKGHRVVLDALAELARQKIRPHLIMAGKDEEVRAADLLARAGALGLAGRVHALGRQEDVRPVLDAIDVLVVASLGMRSHWRGPSPPSSATGSGRGPWASGRGSGRWTSTASIAG
jgi:glycosyltransferase involved in cell wall biosynthesis